MDQQTPPPLPADKDVVRKEHLRLLSIAYYISGAIGILSVSFLLLHLALFISFAAIPDSAWTTKNGATPPPRIIFVIFAALLGTIIIVGWALGGLTIFAGRCIRSRKRFVLIVIAAAINCAFFPYGTLLGVLTFIVLFKAETKKEFQRISP